MNIFKVERFLIAVHLLGVMALAQSSPPVYKLEQLEQMALKNNPTLQQAEAEVRIAAGRKQQSGLYPNPLIGYTGEEIRGGSFRGGQHGFFVEQEIVLGGKLKAASNVHEQERVQAEFEAEEQRLRVRNGVLMLYYEMLAAQRNSDVHRELVDVNAEAVRVTKQLANVGQADETDVIQAEIDQQQAEMALISSQNNERRSFRVLAVMIGEPDLPPGRVVGNIDADLPDIESEPWLQRLLEESPAVKIAKAGVQRAEAQVVEARKAPIPNLHFRGGMQQNRELLDNNVSPVGLQGFAELGVRLPLFNRNQGSKRMAEAEVDRARQEFQRVQLVLRERYTAIFEAFKTSRSIADRYRKEVLPRAQRIHELAQTKYQQMVSSYPQVLVAKRNWLQAQMDYVASLEDVWTAAIALRGYLLTDGLEAPARSGEMDRPVREINLPRPRSRMER